jgi:hypothetical protein
MRKKFGKASRNGSTRSTPHPKKDAVRQKLSPGKWTRELVVNVVRHPIELELFAEHGVKVHQLADVVAKMIKGPRVLDAAAGGSLFDLVALTTGLHKAGA